VIGVPTSAGAFAPGQERVPRALREAGLLDALRAADVAVSAAGGHLDAGEGAEVSGRRDPRRLVAGDHGGVAAPLGRALRGRRVGVGQSRDQPGDGDRRPGPGRRTRAGTPGPPCG
jgi:arginase